MKNLIFVLSIAMLFGLLPACGNQIADDSSEPEVIKIDEDSALTISNIDGASCYSRRGVIERTAISKVASQYMSEQGFSFEVNNIDGEYLCKSFGENKRPNFTKIILAENLRRCEANICESSPCEPAFSYQSTADEQESSQHMKYMHKSVAFINADQFVTNTGSRYRIYWSMCTRVD